MMKSRLLFTVAVMSILSVRAAIGHSAGHGHRHETLGEPGDPAQPTRIVEITMREDEANIQFTPEQVDVRKGEQIRFKITIEGQVKCVLGTKARIESQTVEHDHSHSKDFAKFASGELLWRFTQAGQFAFGCMIPGHLDREIRGNIIVK